MSLVYQTQNPVVLVGSKIADGTRTGIELESTYSTTEDTEPTKSFAVGGHSKLSLDILYTMGATESGNVLTMKVESSPDKINWYSLVIDTTATASVITNREWELTGSDASTKAVNVILDIAYKYMRISFKETGVAANKGKVFCEGTLSGY